MSDQLAGSEINIIDLSLIVGTGLKGIVGVIGTTDLGIHGNRRMIGTWDEFKKYYGGLRADTVFPLLMKRALEAGARLKVSRAGHYTDTADQSTLVGTKATAAVLSKLKAALVTITLLTNTPSAITTGASGTFVVSATNVTTRFPVGSTFKVTGANLGNTTYTVTAVAFATNTTITVASVPAGMLPAGATLHSGVGASFTVEGDITSTVSAADTITVAGANTGNGDYLVTTATLVSGDTVVVVDATTKIPVGMGTTGATALYGVAGIEYEAEAVGDGYNNFTITHTPNIADPANIDITIQSTLYPDVKYTTTNVEATMAAGTILTFNNGSLYFKVTGTQAASGFTEAQPAGGIEDVTLVVEADYEGATGTNPTGIRVFDEDGEITRIAIPAMNIPSLDKTLADYVDVRGDLMGIHSAPYGLDGYTAVEYREGTGVYAGAQPIDSWKNIMFYGGLKCKDPLSGFDTEVSVIGDALGIMSNKDNKKHEWYSFSGYKRGKVRNALGMVYNLGTPARKVEAGYLVAHGLVPFIQHSSFGLVAWGNKTLQKQPTLLCNANIAELMIFIKRSMPSLIDTELFDPNDPDTWDTIYKHVTQFMDYIKDQRAMYDWKLQGDTDMGNLVVNNANDIGQGKFKFRIFTKPTPAMDWIQADVAVTNADVDFAIFENADI